VAERLNHFEKDLRDQLRTSRKTFQSELITANGRLDGTNTAEFAVFLAVATEMLLYVKNVWNYLISVH
jgi:hypothetical protein